MWIGSLCPCALSPESCLHRLAADVGSLCACRPRLLFQPQPLADAEPLDLDADEVATCLEALCTV